MTVALCLAYKGTAYCGWQVQPNGNSIQATVQDALQDAFGVRAPLTGCSRTDAGVHAKGFVCKAQGLPDSLPVERIPASLNRKLPPDIAVKNAYPVPDTFHPRYDASGKRYRYTIRNSRLSDPFDADVCVLWERDIPVSEADALCRRFCGTHDFRSFMAAGSSVTDTVRTVTAFTCTRHGELVYFDICADGFLYHMVRILVGTVLDILAGTLKDTPERILEAKDRACAGRTMPAKGLCLEEVYYLGRCKFPLAREL